MSATTSAEIDKTPLFSDDQLAAIQSWADAEKLVAAAGVPVENFDDYGTGFKVLEDKGKLIKEPFVILEHRFSQGDKGLFASLVIVVKSTNQKLIINDGSTGIRDQLLKVDEKRTEKGIDVRIPIVVPNGLRVSEYDYADDKTGEVSRAKTYYLS